MKNEHITPAPQYRKFKRLCAVALVFCLLLLAGCGETALFGADEERTSTYRMSERIFLPMEEVRTLNPAISKDKDTYEISKLLYDGLFALDENLIPQKKLVEFYSYDENALVLSLTLRQGVLWHDGAAFTAADVKFSIEAYQSLSYTNDTIYGDYVSNIRAVNTVQNDPHAVTISFRDATSAAVENLVFPILPAHQFRRAADMKSNIERFIPVGTGAYQVESYNSLSNLVLKANPDYFGEVARNRLEFMIFPQKKDALNLLNSGNITILFDSDVDRDILFNNMDAQSVSFVSNEAEVIGFNLRSAPARSRMFRQAIAYAIDANEILESAYLNSGVLSDTIYYPNYYGIAGQEEPYAYDLERAALLLAGLGYRDVDGDGYLDDSGGGGLLITILVNEEDPSRVQVAQIIKNELDKLALNTYINYCDAETYRANIEAGTYDLFIGGYAFNERYDLRGVLHSAYGNRIGYANVALDPLLDAMQSGVSIGQKTELFRQVHAILVEDIPYYCLLYKTHGAIVSRALDGEVKPLFHNIYNGCERWVCRYEMEASE